MEVDKQRISELVTKVQNGDNSAFEELYKLTSERAYFIALEFTKNNQDAEDILQESYIKALSKINELDKPESFSSWFSQIVANKSKDFLKKKKPVLFEAEENEVFEILPDEDTNFQPEENLDQTELQKAVMEVLDELSEEKRACVLMMYFEELSVSEISKALEIPEGTVKTRLFSARKDLKDKFEKRGITSAFSFAPIGVVLWSMRRTSATVSESFAASSASAKVLAGITSASTATAVTTSAAATATGIGAKIAAMTVAQKVIAGVSVAAVVTGSTVGTVTVVNSNKNKNTELTVHTEEYTTAPSFETTLVVDALGTVEFSETTDLLPSNTTTPTAAKTSTEKNQSTTNKTTAKTSSVSATQTTTKKQSTTQKPTTTTKKPTTTTKKATTTTKKQTTTRKATTTTKKQTTTAEATTARPATTRLPTTTEEETTTETTTQAEKAIVTVNYTIADYDGEQPEPYVIEIPAGSSMSANELQQKMISELGLSFISFYEAEFPEPAAAGKEYVITGMATL